MIISLHPEIERRIRDTARELGMTESKVIEDAVKRFLGLEGVPLGDDVVFGEEVKKAKIDNKQE